MRGAQAAVGLAADGAPWLLGAADAASPAAASPAVRSAFPPSRPAAAALAGRCAAGESRVGSRQRTPIAGARCSSRAGGGGVIMGRGREVGGREEYRLLACVRGDDGAGHQLLILALWTARCRPLRRVRAGPRRSVRKRGAETGVAGAP